MAERVKPSSRIDPGRVAARKDDSACADRRADDALAHDAVADRCRSVVAGPGGDLESGRQSGRSRGRITDSSGNIGTFEDGRQPASRNLERIEDLIRPCAPAKVQQQSAGSVRHVGGVFAGEPEADVVLGQEDAAHFGVGLGLVLAKPQDLRRLKTRDRGIACDGDQSLGADLLGDGLALGRRPLIAPQDCRPDDPITLVEEHGAVHLPREPEAQRRVAKLGDDAVEHGLARVPPRFGILLCPSRPRRHERVFLGGRGEHVAAKVDRDGSRPARADVEPDQRTELLFRSQPAISRYRCSGRPGLP